MQDNSRSRERGRDLVCSTCNLADNPLADRPMSHLSIQFSTGRGGAGNIHRSQSRDAAMTAEQFAQIKRGREPAPSPTTHIGRGGAGNFLDPAHPRESCEYPASLSALPSFYTPSSSSGVCRQRVGAHCLSDASAEAFNHICTSPSLA